LNLPWVARWVRRHYVDMWVASWGTATLASLASRPEVLGLDARVYHHAALAMLSGRDPWSVGVQTPGFLAPVTFAAPPITLIPFVATAWLPEHIVVLASVVVSLVAALIAIYWVRLPCWWLLFPPIVEGVYVGNLNPVVLVLLLSRRPGLQAVAVILKLYVALPALLLYRWRALILAGVVLLMSMPLLPWATYIDNFGEISRKLEAQSWGGRTSVISGLAALVIMAAAFAVMGRSRAAWLVIPVMWPASQLHYSVLALPALAPVIALAMSVPIPGLAALGVAFATIAHLYHRVAGGRVSFELTPRRSRRRSEH